MTLSETEVALHAAISFAVNAFPSARDDSFRMCVCCKTIQIELHLDCFHCFRLMWFSVHSISLMAGVP
jgi:hypothetical protein